MSKARRTATPDHLLPGRWDMPFDRLMKISGLMSTVAILLEVLR